MNENFPKTKQTESVTNTISNDNTTADTNTAKKRTRKTSEEKISEYENQIKQLQAKMKQEKAKASADERKKRTKQLIELGSVIYSYLGGYEDGDKERLAAFIKSQDERGDFFSKAMKRK